MFNNVLDKMRKSDIKKKVRQGPDHQTNITNLFKEIMEAARYEFNEDNDSTLASFLDECYEDARNEVLKHSSKRMGEFPRG